MSITAILLLGAAGAAVFGAKKTEEVIMDTHDNPELPFSGNEDDRIDKLARAIARAEGFYVTGSLPNRINNPGDVTKDFIKKSTGMQAGTYPKFATAADGWANLKYFLRMWFDGRSRIYTANMTIREVASHYTATDQDAWAANVARDLGVNIDTRLSEL